MNLVAASMVFWSVLVPTKVWFAPDQPVMINVQPQGGAALTLVLTDFTGKPFDPRELADVQAGRTVDLRSLFTQMSLPGTYVLFAVAKSDGAATGADVARFVGTPIVIEVRQDKRRDAPPGPLVIKIEPLRYA